MNWGMSVNGRPFTTQDAARLVWPTVRRDVGYMSDRAVADRPRFTRKAILERLITNKRWLYDHIFGERFEEGFDFLGETEKRRLCEAVEAVRLVAGEIPEGGQPTAEQLDRAREPFADVVEVMGFDRYDEADDFYFGKQIEQRLKPRPPQLDGLRFESGLDHSGFPALWVWAFVSESVERDEGAFFAAVDQIHPVLEEAAREVAPDRWPYISFRSALVPPEVEAAA